MTQKPMTKAQLVSALADATGSDKASSNRMLDALSGIITKEVAAGGAVTVNISAPLVDDTVVESILPAIEKARRMNLA